MKKSLFGLAAIALIAGFFALAPATASAQSVGVGVNIRNGHTSVGIYVGDGHRGGWRGNGGWHGNRGPVYRNPGCNRGCGGYDYPRGGGYGYQREVITVYVDQYVKVWDRSCGRYVQRRVQVPVRAYWDDRRGGYWYTDQYGNYVPVNY